MVIARVEALIAGWGMKEALRRAHAYADAGADMVLIHSKSKTAAEILEFMRLWDRPTPVVVVPTLYPSVTFEELEGAGVKMVIWANQRAARRGQGMQQTLATLARERRLGALDPTSCRSRRSTSTSASTSSRPSRTPSCPPPPGRPAR